MSWQQDFSSSIKSIEEANLFFNYTFSKTNYPIFIPRKFAQKILKEGPESVLWKQFLPNEDENNSDCIGRYDPIGDKVHSKGNQIIHRYHNRILFTPTTVCPIICRYCFRKNELSKHDKIFDPHFFETLEYIVGHPEINEIIFSGGDPLILSNEKIEFYLEQFSNIQHIKYIRFHTRTPVILPSRIDEELLKILRKYSLKFNRLNIAIHVNHIDEIDAEVCECIKAISHYNIDLLSQTVLLKNINDKTETLYNLFVKLIDLKIQPYYLHHPDRVLGAMHFYMGLEEGRRIFAPLHNLLPGWAIPQYVIDIPGGEGKIQAINPENFEFSGNLLNKNGQIIKLD